MHADARQFANKLALEANLSQLKAEFLMKGVQAIDPARFSIDLFESLPLEKQQAILSNISSYLKILSEDITPRRDRRDYEIERLKCALKSFKVRLSDQDFYSKIGQDDFVEFYNSSNIQLYRSVRFFSLCSYSLLDLSVNPWDELYEKPVGVMSEVISHIERAKESADTVECSIGSFLQREKFAYANATQLRTFLVNFRHFTALVDAETGNQAGFLCTFTADILAEGESSSKFIVL